MKLVWICSKNDISEAPVPKRERSPNRAIDAALTSLLSCKHKRELNGLQNKVTLMS